MVKFVYDDNKRLVLLDDLIKRDTEKLINKISIEEGQQHKKTDVSNYHYDYDYDYMKRCINYTGELDVNKTVAYARVSTRKQDINNQINLFRDLFNIRVIFADRAISGKVRALQRPDFKEMMKYIDEHPEINTVVVFEISRLGRGILDAINTFAELLQRGVKIISLTEPWTYSVTEEFKDLFVVFISWMNEMELKRIRQRTIAGLARARAQGRVPGRKKSLSDNMEIRKKVEDFRKKGWSWDEIAHHKDISCSLRTLDRARKRWERQDLGRS